jgi:hypothetical protein
MPKRVHAIHLTPEQLAAYACNDCGSNVVEIGEFYMLRPEIWGAQLGLDRDDNLCIGCLEKRLGREVSLQDMCGIPQEPFMKPISVRLTERLGFQRRQRRDRKAKRRC